MDASEPEPTPTPHAQFDFADSDIALQSSDNVLFRVHKANLGAFSAVFRNMFADAAGQGEPETVPVAETSSTLAILLAMCYPAEDPPADFTTLDARVVLACYEATVKYQMWVAGLALRSFVQPLVHLEPFLVAKLAYRLNDSVLMTASAEETLKCDILAKSQEYAAKAGATVWPALLEFHYRRRMEVLVFTSSLAGYNPTASGGCMYCPKSQVAQESFEDLLKGSLPPASAVFDAAPFLQWIDKHRLYNSTQALYCNQCGRTGATTAQPSALDALSTKVTSFSPSSSLAILTFAAE